MSTTLPSAGDAGMQGQEHDIAQRLIAAFPEVPRDQLLRQLMDSMHSVELFGLDRGTHLAMVEKITTEQLTQLGSDEPSRARLDPERHQARAARPVDLETGENAAD